MSPRKGCSTPPDFEAVERSLLAVYSKLESSLAVGSTTIRTLVPHYQFFDPSLTKQSHSSWPKIQHLDTFGIFVSWYFCLDPNILRYVKTRVLTNPNITPPFHRWARSENENRSSWSSALVGWFVCWYLSSTLCWYIYIYITGWWFLLTSLFMFHPLRMMIWSLTIYNSFQMSENHQSRYSFSLSVQKGQ